MLNKCFLLVMPKFDFIASRLQYLLFCLNEVFLKSVLIINYQYNEYKSKWSY